ncbi:YbaB/EbfC family nucleoid-associated protein [Nocardia otitidiscaviarum]|uniref:YbaB/EbfC family nucleoid-associated protein n=1 Tax=Nocardia otitidiscaviarum TaxID=1823 RepID=UPI0018955445|nr:YbaB/EbfC family nucleoid-associated protein [Nocardia otitidiscaviarum]
MVINYVQFGNFDDDEYVAPPSALPPSKQRPPIPPAVSHSPTPPEPSSSSAVTDTAKEQEEFDRQLTIVRGQINYVHRECRAQLFQATSSNGYASAVVSGTGEVVDLTVGRGFGDLTRPTWMLASDIESAADAIVAAINDARSRAAEDTAIRFSRAFRHRA